MIIRACRRQPFSWGYFPLARNPRTILQLDTPLAPDAPAFRFAYPGKLQAILSEAGITATSERLLQFSPEQ